MMCHHKAFARSLRTTAVRETREEAGIVYNPQQSIILDLNEWVFGVSTKPLKPVHLTRMFLLMHGNQKQDDSEEWEERRLRRWMTFPKAIAELETSNRGIFAEFLKRVHTLMQWITPRLAQEGKTPLDIERDAFELNGWKADVQRQWRIIAKRGAFSFHCNIYF